MNEDPLSTLLLDVSEVNRTRLASTLRDILGIDTESGQVVLKPGFSELTTRLKVLAYLLGRKAAALLGKADIEAAAPRDISQETGMPSGTVNPKLRELRDSHLVSQTESGQYYVAPHQFLQAIDELEKAAK